MRVENREVRGKIKTWLSAARPRTVLLSLSGVMMGGFLAAREPLYDPVPIFLAALTAILLQILSNLANDYGDFKKGLDNAERTGPQRVMQSGELTEKQMRRGIMLTAVLAWVSGAFLVFVAAHLTWRELAVFAVLGLGAVAAAMLYTLGKRPYGYRGLGDLFCFLFFGWVAVVGTYYLASKTFDLTILLPATAVGFLSNAVLNINNMRDYENDKAKGKNSLVVKLGLKRAFIYHVVLIFGAFLCLSIYLWLKQAPWYTYAIWLLFPLFLMDLITIKKTFESGCPDRLLPKQVVQTFLLTLAFGLLFLLANQ